MGKENATSKDMLHKLFAKSFGKDYAPNYVSKLRFINTTKMNGKYCGFVGVKGLYASLDFNQKSYRFNFNDPNFYPFYNTLPLISLRSYAMYNDKILTKHLKDGNSNYSSTTLRDICNDSAYLEGGQKIYPAAKRALEIYSPLNAKMVSHYNYNINSILDNGDLIVIEFSTRDGIFPKKSRIKVSGIMYCRLSTNTIEKIVVENHIDQYSMLPRMSFNDKTVSVTKHRIELNYVRDGNHIYLKKIVANGEGSALMRSPELAAEIVKAVKRAVSVPVTVKIRAGWDSVTAPEFAKRIEAAGADMICVHARTREQMYVPGVDISVIADVKQAVSVPVIGNGDVYTLQDAKNMLDRTGCDGIMIARGALGEPWLFSEIKAHLEGSTYTPPTPEERLNTAKRHLFMMLDDKPERRAIAEAKKHVAWYIKDIRGAAAARDAVMCAETPAAMAAVLDELKNHIE